MKNLKNVKKVVLLVFSFFLFSCNSEGNIEIKNKTLKNEIISLITRIDNNKPCKSDNIIVRFEKTKIYISNAKPVLSIDLVGICDLNKSKIYLYSKYDYYKNYIDIDFRVNKYKIDKNVSSSCEPPMGSVLLIDKKNENRLTKWELLK
jgi:hypothetical protein